MTRLKDGMLLYHGSYTVVENIDMRRCADAKDFGKGFYLTHSFPQAKNFIRSSLRKAMLIDAVDRSQYFGFVSSFRYHARGEGIKIYEFPTTSKEWLWFIALNRKKELAKRLLPRLSSDLFKADIVTGKIANDNTNTTIVAYLSGLYGAIDSDEAVNMAIKRLIPEKLENQYCFLTERSVRSLCFQEARKYVL